MTDTQQEFTDEDTLLRDLDRIYKADLRAFGAIGFQDAPNGLWLGVQGYKPRHSLLKRIIDNAIRRDIDIVGVTSEDDHMIPFSPEDRFGFVKEIGESRREELAKEGYLFATTQECTIGVYKNLKSRELSGKVVYLVNCETRHANKELGQDWFGLKLHVVGGNRLQKSLDLEDAVKDANNRGYMTFLMGTQAHDIETRSLADKVIGQCTGVIGHDANNTFRKLVTEFPIIGKKLKPYSRTKNSSAKKYAELTHKPSIAVSSAHWMHEIGRASISFEGDDKFSLEDLRDAIKKDQFKVNEGYNGLIDVLRFGHLLGKHGGKSDRFAGDPLSSYSR